MVPKVTKIDDGGGNELGVVFQDEQPEGVFTSCVNQFPPRSNRSAMSSLIAALCTLIEAYAKPDNN